MISEDRTTVPQIITSITSYKSFLKPQPWFEDCAGFPQMKSPAPAQKEDDTDGAELSLCFWILKLFKVVLCVWSMLPLALFFIYIEWRACTELEYISCNWGNLYALCFTINCYGRAYRPNGSICNNAFMGLKAAISNGCSNNCGHTLSGCAHHFWRWGGSALLPLPSVINIPKQNVHVRVVCQKDGLPVPQ